MVPTMPYALQNPLPVVRVGELPAGQAQLHFCDRKSEEILSESDNHEKNAMAQDPTEDLAGDLNLE